jgi:hypothetical protein
MPILTPFNKGPDVWQSKALSFARSAINWQWDDQQQMNKY